MRKIEENDLAGKTIKSVDTRCANVTKLVFDDGTFLQLWVEPVIGTSYGPIYGICIADE